MIPSIIMPRDFQTRNSSGVLSLRVKGGKGGFTLIEMLVAVAILTMLVVLVAQMVGSVATGTSSSSKHISADDEARLVFDRMTADFAGMVTRPEVNPLWVTNRGNDAFYFYSQAPGLFTNTSSTVNSDSQIALIGYRVTTNGLERLGKGLGWDDLVFATNQSISISTATATEYSAIAPSVFRLEYTLFMKPGSTNSNGTTNGANVHAPTNNLGQSMNDVAGVVIAIGILDQASRKITPASTINGWSNDTTTFPDAGVTGIPIGSWITNARMLPASSLPAAARSQIRVYQRYFPLNR